MPGGRSGGAATALGADFQARVAAWFAAQMLAGSGAPVLWEWPGDSATTLIASETSDAVDDLRIDNSLGARAYIQAKHRLDLSTRPDSPLAKTLQQFVAQAPLLDEHDRLVLATSSESSASIRHDLPRVLERVRSVDEPYAAVRYTRNASEQHVLEVVQTHLTRSWRVLNGDSPTDRDLHQILRRVFVTVLDLAGDQPHALNAQMMLRTVTADPAAARAAWLQLVSILSEQATLQTELTKASLEEKLLAAGVMLEASLDFRDDIRRLKSLSENNIRRLRSYQSLPGDEGDSILIARPLVSDLYDAVRAGSLVVTGEPGSGKSGALASVIDLVGPTADLVILSADTLDSRSLGALRIELGLEHELVDVLTQWRGGQPGYLVIDALDAGRGSANQEMLLHLAEATLSGTSRWVVLVSIRRFDLRYSPTMKRLFHGQPASVDPEYQLNEFTDVRHFNVPELRSSELESIALSAPRLGRAISHASPTLTALISNLFCLRLFAELVTGNLSEQQMGGIRTRLQLLDAYWNHRVLSNPVAGDRREMVLRKFCALAITSRLLTVERTSIISETNADIVNDLLAERVLIEVGDGVDVHRESIGFAHHVLFDYAVARLLLRRSGTALEELISEPDVLLFTWPSYQLHFENLWQLRADRRAYWETALHISSNEDLPSIAKVIAPSVAAPAVSDISDLQPLLDALRNDAPGSIDCLRHVVSATLDNDVAGASIPAHLHGVWAELSTELALLRREDLLGPLRAILLEFVSTPLTDPVVKGWVGRAGRHMLEWLWEVEASNRFLLAVAIRAVALTFGSAPLESSRLLRSIIDPARMPSSAYLEMPVLANEVMAIAPFDPDLVRDIYVAAFEYKEASSEQTMMHAGVLNLSSNRRQDYEGCHYSLGVHFPEFLGTHYVEAIEALSAIRNDYSSRYGVDPEVIEVAWSGTMVRIANDHELWKPGHADHDTESTLLAAFEAWLTEPEITRSDNSRLARALSVVLGLLGPAAIWRAMLAAAERGTLADLSRFVPVLQSPAAQLATGTSFAIGDVLKIRFVDLARSTRLQIEATIWRLPDGLSGWEAERASLIRDRLLGCLGIANLTLEDAIRHLAVLVEAAQVPQNRRPTLEFTSSEYTENDYLIDRGINPASPEVSLVRAQMAPVEDFASTFLNSQPTAAAVEEFAGGADALWDTLTNRASELPAEILYQGWNTLARASRSASRALDFPQLHPQTVAAIERWLLAAWDQTPADGPTRDIDGFDRDSWFIGDSRDLAVEGLLCIAHYGLTSAAANARIRDLSTDPAPNLRFVVLRHVRLLQRADPELMWELINRGLEDESGAVVANSVDAMSAELFWVDPDRLFRRLTRAYRHANDLGERGLQARTACVTIAAEMYMRLGNATAGEFLNEVLTRIGSEPKEPEAIVRLMRSPFSSSDRDLQVRGFELAVRVANAGAAWLEQLRLNSSSESRDGQVARVVAQSLDHLATEFYFASGAYAGQGEAENPEPPRKVDFYLASRELVQSLSRAPFPSVIHNILKTLDYLLDVDPREIFPIMAKVVDAGRQGNYQFDPMAATLAVAIVQRFMAEHRAVLLDDASCRSALLLMLNIFVDAGWPAARQLTYGLGSVFR